MAKLCDSAASQALFASDLTEAFKAEAEARYPNEACGVIVKVGKRARFVPCRNDALDPKHFFLLNRSDYAEAEKLGEVIAIWHSHPEGVPFASDADRAGCEATAIPWLVSALSKNDASFTHAGPNLIEPSGFEMPYTERPYVFGVFDCYSLLTDYFQREYEIKLTQYPELRTPEWWAGKNYFAEYFEKEGFVEVTDGTYNEGDVLLFAMGSQQPNHVAIYIGNDIILHHLLNRLSRRETCGHIWLSEMTHHLRHKSRC